MWSDDDLRRLETVLVAWVSGGTLSILLGGAVIWHNTRPWRRWPLDMSWIRRGLAVGLTFLVATLSARALLTVDRYIVEYFSSTEFLGAYVVYSSMAMAIMSVLDPAVFSFLYPRLVSAYRTNDMAKYTSTMREMAFSAAGVSALVTIAGAIVAPYVFAWTGKPVYSEHADIFRLLLLAAFIYAMNWVPHYGLYARGADRIILTAHLVSLPVFALTAIPLGSLFPQAAAPLGLVAAFTWLAAFKAWHYWRLRKAQAGALTAATGAGAHASS
jgi:O-antigen/teichoic acid export membrane protein